MDVDPIDNANQAAFEDRVAGLKWACENGYLVTVEDLCNKPELGITRADICKDGGRLIQICCERGYSDIVEFLRVKFKLTPNDFKVRDNAILNWSCRNGQLDVVKYLCGAAELTKDDVCGGSSLAFRWSCMYGHIDVVRYLHTAFGMTTYDAIGDDNQALVQSRAAGRTRVVEYLLNVMKVPYDISDAILLLVKNSAGYGDTRTLYEILSAAKLVATDVIRSDALRACCENGHDRTLTYLTDTFKFDAREKRIAPMELIHLSRKSGNTFITQLITDTFDVRFESYRVTAIEQMFSTIGQYMHAKRLLDYIWKTGPVTGPLVVLGRLRMGKMFESSEAIAQLRARQNQAGKDLIRCLRTSDAHGKEQAERSYLDLETELLNQPPPVVTTFGTNVITCIKELVESIGPYIGLNITVTCTPVQQRYR